MSQATPKSPTPAEMAELDADNALEEACIAALEQAGIDRHLDEGDEIALAKEIVAASGGRFRLYQIRDRLRLIVAERCDAES